MMMTGYAKWMAIGIATILHFLVDGLCVCCLYLMAGNGLDTSGIVALFLTYNILAFMTQPLTGWWIDRLTHRQVALLTATGLLTTAVALQVAAVYLQSFNPSICWFLAIVTAVLLGMGNSAFHVWGGKLTATITNNDMRSLGIFVSSGVVGLTIGVLYASWWLLAGMLLLITVLGVITPRLSANVSEIRTTISQPAETGTQLWFWLLAILLFVLLRSFVGEIVSVGLEKKSDILLLLAITAMLGKAGGGWMARWCGISHSIVACVGITAACMMFRNSEVVPLIPVILGIFAINCTMPMTLHLANRLLPLREGLSFGLLAAVLIPGYLLANGLHLTADHRFMLSALLLTIAVEVGLLMLMGEKRKNVLMGAVAVNILTNVPLNYILLTYGNSLERLIIGELIVLVVEALWYYGFVRQWRRAAIYSLLCNATSFLIGLLIQIITIYLL